MPLSSLRAHPQYGGGGVQDASGARKGAQPPWEFHRVWSDLITALVDASADLTLLDPEHQASALGWAEWARQDGAAELLRRLAPPESGRPEMGLPDAGPME